VFSRLLKTAIFSVVAPGTIGLLLPAYLRKSAEIRIIFPLVQQFLGAAFLAAGVAIYLWCAWDFVSKGMGTPAPIDAPRLLVVKGLYRFTRNPMYVGVSFMILGQAVYFGATALLIYLGAVLAGFHMFVLLYEEPTLRRLFGTQYEEYCRQVPRWVIRG